jgi:hypothetical protein
VLATNLAGLPVHLENREGKGFASLLITWGFRSPLMLEGDLRAMDDATLALLKDPEVLSVNQSSICGRQLFRRGDLAAWTADATEDKPHFLAFFSLNDQAALVEADLSEAHLYGRWRLRDVWMRQDLGLAGPTFRLTLPAHAARLLKLSREQAGNDRSRFPPVTPAMAPSQYLNTLLLLRLPKRDAQSHRLVHPAFGFDPEPLLGLIPPPSRLR